MLQIFHRSFKKNKINKSTLEYIRSLLSLQTAGLNLPPPKTPPSVKHKDAAQRERYKTNLYSIWLYSMLTCKYFQWEHLSINKLWPDHPKNKKKQRAMIGDQQVSLYELLPLMYEARQCAKKACSKFHANRLRIQSESNGLNFHIFCNKSEHPKTFAAVHLIGGALVNTIIRSGLKALLSSYFILLFSWHQCRPKILADNQWKCLIRRALFYLTITILINA